MRKTARHLPAKIFSGLTILSLIGLGAGAYIYQQSQMAATPKDTAAVTTIDPAEEALYSMSTRQKVAALLMLHISGTDQEAVTAFVEKHQPGGLILMGDNLSQKIEDVKTLTDAIQSKAAPYPLFIAIDQEGCNVKRLLQDTYACASQLGRKPNTETESAFSKRSELLHQAGINLNFGIVADITSNEESFIYSRVFSGDPNEAGDKVASAVKGSKNYVWSTLKHFPGHGETNENSHTAIPRTDITYSSWQSHTAIPFIDGIEAGAEAVMFSHLVYSTIDSLPASLSPKWHTILYEDLGFDGLSVTDDLIMLQQSKEANYQDIVSNVLAAIKAGNHIVLIVNDHNVTEQPLTDVDIDVMLDHVATAIDNNYISQEKLDSLVLESLQWRKMLKAKK